MGRVCLLFAKDRCPLSLLSACIESPKESENTASAYTGLGTLGFSVLETSALLSYSGPCAWLGNGETLPVSQRPFGPQIPAR